VTTHFELTNYISRPRSGVNHIVDHPSPLSSVFRCYHAIAVFKVVAVLPLMSFNHIAFYICLPLFLFRGILPRKMSFSIPGAS